jgi:hypothetical protein
MEILACPIRLTQILQKETQKGTKHKAPLHLKEVKKAITSIKQMKGRIVRASEREVKSNETTKDKQQGIGQKRRHNPD